MENTRSNFVPGLVLGIGVGLLLGHATIWRFPSALTVPARTAPFSQTASLAQGPGGMGLLSPHFLLESPVRPQWEESPWEDHWKIDERAISEPLQNALALETRTDPVPAPPATVPVTPVSQPSPGTEPQQLPLHDAAPLSGNTPRDQQIIRELIDLELPHLKPEQRQVWFESLKDVGKEDVVGILRMWKLVGEPDSALPPPVGLPLPKPQSVPAPANTPATNATGAKATTLAAAKAIHRNNLLMANTPGYLPLVPVWNMLQSGQPEESAQLQYRVSLRQTRLVPTGFPLDVAIIGNGFFQVQSADGELCFTRNGQFGLDGEQRLCLTVADRQLRLIPEVSLKQLDSSTRDIQIDVDGAVRLKQATQAEFTTVGQIQLAMPVSSQSFTHLGNGLFQIRDAPTESILKSPPSGDETQSLLQGTLELPAIDPAAETAALDRLDSQPLF